MQGFRHRCCEWIYCCCVQKNESFETYPSLNMLIDSPHDEVKLWPCQHQNSQQSGDGSVNHRGKHMLQCDGWALVSVADRCQEALWQSGTWERQMNWRLNPKPQTLLWGKLLNGCIWFLLQVTTLPQMKANDAGDEVHQYGEEHQEGS